MITTSRGSSLFYESVQIISFCTRGGAASLTMDAGLDLGFRWCNWLKDFFSSPNFKSADEERLNPHFENVSLGVLR